MVGPVPAGDRQFVTSLFRGLEVLRSFRKSDVDGLGNTEIAQRTGLHASTVTRLTYTLAKCGYLTYNRTTGRYSVGARILGLGYASFASEKLLQVSRQQMQLTADLCGEGCMVALGGRDDLTMIYHAATRAGGEASLQLTVGSRISLARSAMGRVYLARAPEEEREALLERLVENGSVADVSTMRSVLDDVQDQLATHGYYANFGDWKADTHSIAVPFRDPSEGNPTMCFSIGGPHFYFGRDRIRSELGPKLLNMVERIKDVAFR